MKQVFLAFIILLSNVYIAKAQSLFNNEIYISFDSSNTSSYIAIDTAANNKWQIGRPDKSVFNTSVVPNNVIVTDTADNCVPGDTSVFYITVPSDYYYPIDGLWFRHWLNMDSGSLAKIDMRFTANDTGWITLTGSSCNCQQWMSGKDTLYGNVSTQGWDTVNINLNYIFMNRWRNNTLGDSTIFRFTYMSNDTSLLRNGWMIDDVYIHYMWEGAAGNLKANTPGIYPNPSNGSFYIKEKNADHIKAIIISDAMGKKLFVTNVLPADGQLHVNLPNGIYVLKSFTEQGVSTQQFMIQN